MADTTLDSMLPCSMRHGTIPPDIPREADEARVGSFKMGSLYPCRRLACPPGPEELSLTPSTFPHDGPVESV